MSEIKPLPPKQFKNVFRPEAGIIINNTENIRELVVQNGLLNQNAGDYEEDELDLYKSICENR